MTRVDCESVAGGGAVSPDPGSVVSCDEVEAPNFGNLPPVLVLRVTFRAEEPQDLPPLATSPLHGALGHALKEMVCTGSVDNPCQSCRRLATCPYPALLEPPAQTEQNLGVTNRAPAPVILAPEEFDPRARAYHLDEGQSFDVRVSLVGEKAISMRSVLEAALHKAAARGMGKPTARDAGEGSARAELRVVSVETTPVKERTPMRHALLRFLTPVRIVSGGAVSSLLTTPVLWPALVRRTDLLARAYGGGPVWGKPVREPGFRVTGADMHRVKVWRVSSRQGRSMEWPGQMGEVWVDLNEPKTAWPMLEFGALVQVGKGTGFGLGRYEIASAQSD
jgi:hypothetical protein